MTNGDDWVDFSEYVRLLRHSWLTLVLFVIAGLLAAWVATRLQDPVYESQLELVLERPQTGILADEGAAFARMDDTFYETQIRILRSELLLREALHILTNGTATLADADPAPDGALLIEDEAAAAGSGVLYDDRAAMPPYVSAKSPTELLQEFAAGLRIDNLPRTRIFSIRTRSSDPVFAAASANSLAKAYAGYVSKAFASSTERTFVLLRKQTDEASRRIKVAAEALLNFKRESEVNALTDPSGTSGALDAAAQKSIRERLAMSDPDLAGLRDELTQVELSIRAQSGRYQAKHPVMAELIARRNALNQRISKLEDQVFANWQRKHSQERSDIEYSMLEQDLEATRKLHDLLVGKLKELDFSKEAPVASVRILKRAMPPTAPDSPRPLVNLPLGAASGLCLGLLVAMVRVRDHARRITVSTCERLATAPVLGWLPHFENPQALNAVLRGDDTQSAEAESFRALRTAVDGLCQPGGNIILITSPSRGDGKSTVSTCLAQSFATLGRSVLLVDVDMRRGRLHQVLLREEAKGLSEFLAGDETVGAVSLDPHLSFMPCGKPSANPAEILASPRMEEFMLRMSQTHHIVLLDSPPLLPVTDASLLARFTDVRLMVVRNEVTETEAFTLASRMFGNLGYNLTGVIVNDVKADERSQYGYYRHSYGSEKQPVA